MSRDDKRPSQSSMEHTKRPAKLSTISGVYIPVYLNILSILMFLRFGLILGQVGLLGILGLLVTAYLVDFLTTLSLSAIASNGEVKGGGAYYLISRSLGPEFGGSIGVLFYLAQVLNTSMNCVGLIDCIRLNLGSLFPQGYWVGYGLQTAALVSVTTLSLAGSGAFARASNALLVVLTLAIVSIPISALFKEPFRDEGLGIEFTGFSFETLVDNFVPHVQGKYYKGFDTFRELFGILFPATSGIFAGASMSGDLRNPSRAIPKGTLWAMLTTFIVYLTVVFSMAASTTHASFLRNANVISLTNFSSPLILAGEISVTFFSAVMGLIGAAKLLQALARDKLLPGMSIFGQGTKNADEPIFAIFLTYIIAQVAMLANLDQIATFISMGYQMTFFVMNLACFLLKIGSAPNFRPAFKFFNWQTASVGSLLSGAAMFFIDETYAVMAVCLLVFLFALIHFLSPPKAWGDVSQNLIYHQVRKYLLRLRPEHIKFWRPQIILLINNPRSQTRLIQFCNSIKKGSLYILGHVIVTDDFRSGVHEARLQQAAWTNYISESSRIKAFVQLTMSPTLNWGIRNLILSAGLGGMRPNIAVMGFYNMDELRQSRPSVRVPQPPSLYSSRSKPPLKKTDGVANRAPMRRRGDTSARLLEGFLPTDVIKTEDMMSVTSYMTILEDLALQYKLNVAIGRGFQNLETPRKDKTNTKKFIDLWPIQMSAEVLSDGKSVLTTNFDTYTLILQLGYILHSVPAWKAVYDLRVMVFVEYENELEEERARVKALLDKLRIQASIRVFCLSDGDLKTYELIVNGRHTDDLDSEIMVNEILQNEDWWEDLQTYRAGTPTMDTSQDLASLANIIDSTAGRPGLFNPHLPPEEQDSRRRASVLDLEDFQKRPTVSNLAKLGVNMGIHTSHLGDEVFGDEDSADETSFPRRREVVSSETDSDFESVAEYPNEEEPEEAEPVKRPLLSQGGAKRSRSEEVLGSAPKDWHRKLRGIGESSSGAASTYGTIGPLQSETGRSQQRDSRPQAKANPVSPFEAPDRSRASLARLQIPRSATSESLPCRSEEPPPQGRSGSATPVRPSISRQSSAVRFSSRPVPEMKVTEETSGPTIGFADSNAGGTSRPERPTFSRQSSIGKFSSRPVPETKVSMGDNIPDGPTVSFAEPFSRSRRCSNDSDHVDPNHVQLNIPELMERYGLGDSRHNGEAEDGGSTTYSSQGGGLALSFNDLPSRAQHLILNELMRRHSGDTAVLFTTLPVPSEGTCHDEEASVRYLSDIEVLCHELPPSLLVLSNNVTVTVGL